ncbi:unnamed protein product [Anisakis simplex]|uniref:Uncharacterized protein n=1 Tax=Anisakis simplex TaxID=6269 RepID=A0A0M3KK79_ANISI|nr:unnamed protein product [Anisakis simplex]
MLNLVAYDASDSEQESDRSESDENCIHAEVVSNPKKGVNIVEKREAVDEDCPEVNVHKEVSDSVADTLESASSGGWSVLDCLPSAAPIHSAKTIDSESLGDNELEELVKRKQWEIKLAKKAEKERRKKEKKLKKRGVKKR